MRNRYLSLGYFGELGRKEFSCDVDQLGSMTDEELVRLDDEIKKMSYTLANKQADEMEKEKELQVLLRGASGALKNSCEGYLKPIEEVLKEGIKSIKEFYCCFYDR